MIIYKTNDWLEAIYEFHTGSTARALLRRLGVAAIYVTAIIIAELNFIDVRLKDVPTGYLSTLGILLSLLLLFRTNTAYDRFYEGRRAWGTLVNVSRNLAVLLNAILPQDAQAHRLFFTKTLSNFPFALRNHLRTDSPFTDLDDESPDDLKDLGRFDHVPMGLVSQLRDRIEQLCRDGLISNAQSINLSGPVDLLLDVAGICERIRSTPIPFSYSFFIKLFITAYIMLLPFVVVDELGYLAIPAVLVTTYVMVGLEMIGEEIEDPFGTERNDLPLSQLAQLIRVNVHDAFGFHLARTEKKAATARYVVVN